MIENESVCVKSRGLTGDDLEMAIVMDWKETDRDSSIASKKMRILKTKKL